MLVHSFLTGQTSIQSSSHLPFIVRTPASVSAAPISQKSGSTTMFPSPIALLPSAQNTLQASSTSLQLPITKPMTTLPDVLQHVPLLLDTCVAGSNGEGLHTGVAATRLICKQTSLSALHALRSYHLTLSLHTSAVEPLLDVARLLQHSHLQVLLV